jgi:hypothetical protein
MGLFPRLRASGHESRLIIDEAGKQKMNIEHSDAALGGVNDPTRRSQFPYYAIVPSIPCSSEGCHAAIAEAAYFHAERRGFAPGHELDDWLAGEAEVEERIIREGREL